MKKTDKIIFVVGPTGIGKSDVAMSLAKEIPAEIVSCDSMQIYQEIQIASNKPSEEMLNSVPHHMLDIVSVEQEYNVGIYNKQATAIIEAIIDRGKTPIVVGGSGMYMQVLLDGIFKGPGEDPELRLKLAAIAKRDGVAALHQRLIDCDPVAAEKIHQNDMRRIIRALEVFELSQSPISVRQKEIEGLWGNADISIFCLDTERAKLYDRINARTQNMFDQGLIEEVKTLDFLKLSKTAKSIIGVNEVYRFLQGECDLVEAKEMMRQNTRRLAKRQLTWFRRDKRIQWLDIKMEASSDTIANQLLLLLKK